MSFVSYAQNYEDVMLWRALKHVKNGFYIDVGAAWPDEHSVTRAFYENGWQGINIEPNPVHHASLMQQRPRDSNLKLAVGDQAGQLTMNFVGDTGLSTAIDAFAKQHEAAGWSSNKQEVELTTLQAICRDHIKPDQPIHFLKVDVEGLEEAVLRGNDWTAYRPWVVVVEATLPMTQTESFLCWEPVLLTARYVFAYADGLNRFYVANEHSELLESFKYPPNVFDSFSLNSQQEAAAKAQQAEAKAEQAEAASNQHLMQLRAVYSSASWQATAPLRWLAAPFMNRSSMGSVAPKRSIANQLIRWGMAQPRLVAFAHRLLRPFPSLRANITRRVGGAFNAPMPVAKPQVGNAPAAGHLAQLTPRSRQIYADIKTAIERRQKENG